MTAIVQSMALILLFETRFVQAISSDVTVYNSDVVRQSPMHVNISKPCKSRPTAMVGTRSRGSRGRLSDNDIRCSASDRRWFPARPAQHVHRRRNNGKAQYNRHSRARMAETVKDGARHATPDAPERIDPRRRCTRHDHRTCCRGSRGSAPLPLGQTLYLMLTHMGSRPTEKRPTGRGPEGCVE